MSKGLGKIVKVKFTEKLTGNVRGLNPPLAYRYRDVAGPSGGVTGQTYSDDNHYSSYYGSNAFDGNDSTYWYIYYPSFPDMAQINFAEGEKYAVSKVRMYTTSSYCPNGFTVQGSYDGSVWDDIYSGNFEFVYPAWQEIGFENEIEYEKYRFVITSSYGSSSRVRIYSLELCERVLVGQERGFAIDYEEPLYTKIPSKELGPLQAKSVSVSYAGPPIPLENGETYDTDAKIDNGTHTQTAAKDDGIKLARNGGA